MIIYDPKITGSFQINGSTISSVGEIDNLSGSVAALNNASSSYLLNTTDTLTGNLTVTGTLTAQEFHTEYTSASIVYQSGSTKFGDTYDDVHQFTGSVNVTNSTGGVTGSYTFTGGNFTISGDDADFNLNITSGSALANLTEFRFQTDGGTMGRLYMHKGTKHMYLGPTYFPTSSLYLQDGTGTVMSITGSSVGIGTDSPGATLDVNGGIHISAASNPSFTFASNDSAIINRTGASSGLYFQKGGSTQMVIDSSGNVGIGTASPNQLLHLDHSGNKNAAIQLGDITTISSNTGIYFRTTGNAYISTASTGTHIFDKAGTERMRINANGNVGIGTDSPTGTYGKLTVNGSISLLDDQNTKLEIGRYSAGAPNSYIKLGANSNSLRITNNTDTADLVYIQNDGKVTIGKDGHSGNATLTVKSPAGGNTGIILIEGDTTNDGHGLYATTDNKFVITRFTDGSYSDNFVMDSTGKVGIGITSPSQTLDVDGNIRTTSALRIEKGPSNTIGAGGNIYFIGGTGASYSQIQQGADRLDFWGFDGANWGINMTIDNSNRRIGIGTPTPAALLTTVGSAFSVSNSGRAIGGILVYADSGGVGGYGGAISFGTGGLGSSAIAAVSGPGSDRDVNGLAFFTHGSSSGLADSAEVMRIQYDGNVRIGGGSAYAGTGVTSLSINNDQYPALSLGSTSASRMALISYSSYNLFTSSNPFVFDTSSPVYINSTINAGASARLSIFNNDTQEGLAIKMAGTTPYSPIAVRNQDNNYMFQVSQTGEVRINDAGIGINETLRIKGVETALRTYGSQSGYTQGAIVISSGTDSVPSARGQGVFLFNEGTDITWYAGSLYTSTDRFDICRKSSTTDVDASTAQSTYSLFHLNNAGSAYNATGTWGTISSDQRLKENIVNATPKLDDVMSLQVRNFNYIGKEEKYIGFIAQELEQVFPSLVTTNDMREFDRDGNVIGGLEDTKGVKVGMDFAILVKAIQEQQAIIEDLKARIQTLENN